MPAAASRFKQRRSTLRRLVVSSDIFSDFIPVNFLLHPQYSPNRAHGGRASRHLLQSPCKKAWVICKNLARRAFRGALTWKTGWEPVRTPARCRRRRESTTIRGEKRRRSRNLFFGQRLFP